jgi:PTS system beta-glucosides-specific IIC component
VVKVHHDKQQTPYTRDQYHLVDEVTLLLGGEANILGLTHCFVRLRFQVKNSEEVDLAGLNEIPDIAVAAWQGAEVHVAPKRDLLALYDRLLKRVGE